MNDPFAQYGEAQAHVKARTDVPPVKPVTALEKKMAERQRLSAAYRLLKKQERAEILAEEPRLLDFLRYLRRIKADDGDELVEAVRDSWLTSSSQHVRLFALNRVGNRTDQIRRSMGLTAMDDPLPTMLGGYDSVFFQVRNVLAKGIRL